MKYLECFKFLASKRRDELVVTSAGNSNQAWWAATHDTRSSFYLGASMSLSTMFASGLAFARPEVKVWAFMGDGALSMNTGMLFVERQMNLPNLTHFLVSNGCYGGTGNADLPSRDLENDYVAIATAMGLKRVYSFDSLAALEAGFDDAVSGDKPGHTFVVLEVERFREEDEKDLGLSPMDGPEMKYRFGRRVEELTGADVFGYRV
jgi:sulfopyruvate decarboxylase subunit beta